MYIGKVVQIGNALGVVLPAPMRRAMGVLRGDYVRIDEAEGEVTIRSNDAKKAILSRRKPLISSRIASQQHRPK